MQISTYLKPFPLARIINSTKTYYSLLGLNVIIGFFIFLVASNVRFPDETGYLLMGESLKDGATFSSWYFLPFETPETLRTWGYPFFLFLARSIIDSLLFIKLIQFVSYVASLFIIIKIIKLYTADNAAVIFFLLLSCINIQIPYYAGLISAEALTIFFVSLYCYALLNALKRNLNSKDTLALAILGFVCFQLRPAFLLLPFFMLIVYWITQQKNRKNLKYLFLHLVMFCVSLLPFGYWNYQHHHIFKLTPLQGGAGIAHIGYWAFRLPANYTENFNWSNNVGDDLFMNLIAERKEHHATLFEAEWLDIQARSSIYLNHNDSIKLKLMAKQNPGIFILYNSEYTITQEKLLWKYLIKHIRENPVFYFKTRLLSFCRLWFTGLNQSEWKKCASTADYLKMLIPFLITFVSIFLGLIFISLNLLKFKEYLLKYSTIYFFILYWGICHIAFAIQSRYTVPVHLLTIALLSCVLTDILFKKIKDPGNYLLATESD
jgi:hypothetical protein